ncbi:hypothetical protein GWI33_019646 [Rhynchophorus ferrugineus]|uniref:Uncharacterized protein n=1 Tax=Rhynchophorus ferrugineus TaxID=354439 RepID=A0A834HTB4_RHYFE|nr:hypothetical protein GWI33_019646 [Rhynchophorus ferrugineus]
MRGVCRCDAGACERPPETIHRGPGHVLRHVAGVAHLFPQLDGFSGSEMENRPVTQAAADEKSRLRHDYKQK